MFDVTLAPFGGSVYKESGWKMVRKVGAELAGILWVDSPWKSANSGLGLYEFENSPKGIKPVYISAGVMELALQFRDAAWKWPLEPL